MRKTINGLLKCLSVFLAILFVIQIVPNRFYEAAGALIANAFAEEESPFETVGVLRKFPGRKGARRKPPLFWENSWRNGRRIQNITG